MKERLKEQLEVLETYINDIPLIIDPCKNCKWIDDNRESHIKNTDMCKQCCWYYDSQFRSGHERK